MFLQRADILVVEDDEVLQATLTDLLMDKEGRAVTVVSTGANALAVLDAVRPRLLIIDITLPALDGIAAYRLIRERADVATVPVLFLAALTDAEIAVQIDKPTGPYRRLNKPFNIRDFDAAVHDLMAEATR
jgi:DNA-binding response OmpR family regulator